MAANMAMMAMTTNNSINVKAEPSAPRFFLGFMLLQNQKKKKDPTGLVDLSKWLMHTLWPKRV